MRRARREDRVNYRFRSAVTCDTCHLCDVSHVTWHFPGDNLPEISIFIFL